MGWTPIRALSNLRSEISMLCCPPRLVLPYSEYMMGIQWLHRWYTLGIHWVCGGCNGCTVVVQKVCRGYDPPNEIFVGDWIGGKGRFGQHRDGVPVSLGEQALPGCFPGGTNPPTGHWPYGGMPSTHQYSVCMPSVYPRHIPLYTICTPTEHHVYPRYTLV